MSNAQPERRFKEAESWHLDKKVPISIIVVLTMQFASGLWFLADIKKDVEILKVAVNNQHDRDDRQDKDSAMALVLLRAQLEKMDLKLDRVLERRQ